MLDVLMFGVVITHVGELVGRWLQHNMMFVMSMNVG